MNTSTNETTFAMADYMNREEELHNEFLAEKEEALTDLERDQVQFDASEEQRRFKNGALLEEELNKIMKDTNEINFHLSMKVELLYENYKAKLDDITWKKEEEKIMNNSAKETTFAMDEYMRSEERLSEESKSENWVRAELEFKKKEVSKKQNAPWYRSFSK